MWKGRGATGAKTFRNVTAGADESELSPAVAIPMTQTLGDARTNVYLVEAGIILRAIGFYCCLIFGLT
jgi:hypothetical protein